MSLRCSEVPPCHNELKSSRFQDRPSLNNLRRVPAVGNLEAKATAPAIRCGYGGGEIRSHGAAHTERAASLPPRRCTAFRIAASAQPARRTARVRAQPAAPAPATAARLGSRLHPPPQHRPGGPREILTPWRPAAPSTGGAARAASPGHSSPRQQLRSPVAAGRCAGPATPRRPGQGGPRRRLAAAGPSGAARALGSAPLGPGSHGHQPRQALAGSGSSPRAGGGGGSGGRQVHSCRQTGRRSPSPRETGSGCGAFRRDVSGR